MYKLGGRGGGRGGGSKRPPAPHGRGRGASSSMGGLGPPPRGRAAAAAASPAAQAEGREESFSLESSGPPAFAAVVRLTPDLIDEIRRAEEAGGGARIMFNSNINPAENIIDVDGKEFNFTWSSEPGELCDIYEERQSGEGGNGLLVERGSAWRKVNVQRILDESAKNQVKMRSEEAERLSKSRKSIVLDATNPSVKIQAKSMAAAAVEGNMRRMKWNQKKEHFKKNQAAVIPTKSISKVKLPNNSIAKGNLSTSPALSPEQPGSSIPSFAAGSDANNEVIVPYDLNKEENIKVEKATPNRISQGPNRRASSVSASVDDNATDLRSLLISILSENPKGMNLKALEKAVADVVPNASKKIESIIKNVANYQAPGRYLLKPELEVEISKHHASGSGRTIDENIDEAAPSLQIDDPDIFEKIEIGGSPVSAAGDEKVNDSDGKAGTSSESGSDSDSDSDSSGSGSDSGSGSAASGSGSSSDSDSDASSSSKEGSDAFVDITSDDNKADTSGRKVADELKLSSSPRDLPTLDGDDEQIDIGTNLDYTSTSSHIDLNSFNMDNDDAAYTAAATENISASNVNIPSKLPGGKNMASARSDPSIVDGKYPANRMSYKDNLFDDSLAASSENLPIEEAIQFTKQHSSRRKSTPKDGTNHVLTRTSEKGAKATMKRGSDNEDAATKPESVKKAKVDVAYSGATGSSSEHRQIFPPDKHVNERLSKETGNVGWDTHPDLHLKDSIPSMKGRPPASGNLKKKNQSPNISIQTMHSEGTQEQIAKTISKKKIDKMQKPSNSMDGNFGKGYVHVDDHHVNFDDSDDSVARKRGRHGGSFVDEKLRKGSKDANIDANSMNIAKGVRGNVNHNVVMSLPECTETNGGPSILQRNNVDRSPPGKKVLQREQSDLELGELREGSLENDIERTRQLERNSSSKSLDGKAINVDNSHPSMNNRKVAASAFHDQRKPSAQEFSTVGNLNLEGLTRKTPGYDFDNNRSQQRVIVSQGLPLPRTTNNPDSENILHPDRLLEKTGKTETKMAQGGVLDHVDPKKKKTTPKLPQNGTKNGVEPRTRKSISPAENEQSRNNSLIETDTGRKRRDSSSDEDNLFFSKYDKEEPELKGPIKDFSQYQDYLQEYNEKHEVYSYLNSQLKKTQSEFLKIQEDFDASKERDKDQYYSIVERIRDMYHESGPRHKLMKKVFLLLHEELLTIKQRIQDFADAYSNE